MASEVAKHTPGPWMALPQNGAGPMIVHEFETGNQMNPTGYRLIAHMLQRGNSLEQDRANARLIAAAPDMLAALSLLHKWFEVTGSSIHTRWDRIPTADRKAIVDATRAALSKAVRS